MKVKEAVVLGVSILSGCAVFDGIAKSFPKTSNPALIVGQATVALANGIFAFGVTAGIGYGANVLMESFKKYEEEKEDTVDGE